jgi:hypothetical protein
MLIRCACVVLLACAVVIPSASLGAAEDPAGLWVGITEVPEQGTDQVTLTISKANGGLTGAMSDSLYMVAKEDLRDVRFADGILTFGFTLTDGTAMTMKLTLTGHRMAGEWQTPDGEVGAITFERKPKQTN